MNLNTSELFQNQAEQYSKYRLDYPDALYDFLESIVPAKNLAWDCATGNGQAAAALAQRFKHVVATDISERQIAECFSRPNIQYKIVSAEAAEFPPNSIDLITVAQAYHWFDQQQFLKIVGNVLRSRGILAIWGYSFNSPISPEVDAILEDFYFIKLGPFWAKENKQLWNRYESVHFPFDSIQAPEINIQRTWTLQQLIQYFSTWSSLVKSRTVHGDSLLSELQNRLTPLWGHGSRALTWDLHLKVWRK